VGDKVIHSQGHEIAFNVHKFLKAEVGSGTGEKMGAGKNGSGYGISLDTVWESRRVRDSKPYPGRIQP
jgi:hypothetical protein